MISGSYLYLRLSLIAELELKHLIIIIIIIIIIITILLVALPRSGSSPTNALTTVYFCKKTQAGFKLKMIYAIN